MGAPVSRSEQWKGARLGAYEIVALIGHGATASVFEARHVALGKPVAIKILHEHLAQDEQLRDRFLREGRVAARLRHPNIVDVLDVGVEKDVPYLVMELLHGSDLRQLLLDTHVLSLEHALGFLLPVASALAHAHDAGIVHRDLKPANIFLARDVRDDIVPKLVDFGLSKAAGFDEAALTATEMVAGTVLYMAPEQTVSVKNASAASDQYALAAILYECATGQPPFRADGVYALIEEIRRGIVRPPSQVDPSLPAAFDAILLRALDVDFGRRYPSVRAFARDLLPFAAPSVATLFERDFADRASGATRTSRPSVRRASDRVAQVASPEAVTRVEAPSEPPRPSVRDGGARESASRQEAASGIRAIAPLPCAPGASPFQIKGFAYRGFVQLVEHTVPGGMDAFCEALSDERLRPFVRQQFLATVRYDILPFLPLFATLSKVVGTPFEPLVSAAAAAQARFDAQNVFKRIFDGISLTDFGDRLARFGAQYYNFGASAGALVQPDVLCVTQTSVPAYVLPWYGVMNLAYTVESARLVGAKDIVKTWREATPSGTHEGFPVVTTSSFVRFRL